MFLIVMKRRVFKFLNLFLFLPNSFLDGFFLSHLHFFFNERLDYMGLFSMSRLLFFKRV